MKKLVAMLMSLAMLMGTFGVSAMAAEPEAVPAAKNEEFIFTDVASDYWAAEDIRYFASLGIVAGLPDGSFAPTDGVTREEFAKMLVLTFRASLSTEKEPTFKDVEPSRWSYPYVETSKSFLTGYVSPFDGTMTFHPEEAATREDIAVALIRMMGLSDTDVRNPNYARSRFSDGSDITPAVLPYVSLAAEMGLLSGYPDGTFKPQQGISRAEAVVLLNRSSKQAVTTVGDDIELNVKVEQDRKTLNVFYVTISTEKGMTVTVNGEPVTVTTDGDGKTYSGVYTYTFEKEGTKALEVVGTKLGKTKTATTELRYQIPEPTLTVNPVSETSKNQLFYIGGTVSDPNGRCTVWINDKLIPIDYKGAWQAKVQLEPGKNTIKVKAVSTTGKEVEKSYKVTLTETGPVLTIKNCPSKTNNRQLVITGFVSDPYREVSLKINGEPVKTYKYYDWQATVLLNEGENTITFEATNTDGETVKETRVVILEYAAPAIMFYNCPEQLQREDVTIVGQVSAGQGTVKLFLNDEPVRISYNGEFSLDLTVEPGTEKTLTFRAVNSLGKETVVEKTIKGPELQELAPPIAAPSEQPTEQEEQPPVETGEPTPTTPEETPTVTPEEPGENAGETTGDN